jgi:hypothetical protein
MKRPGFVLKRQNKSIFIFPGDQVIGSEVISGKGNER